MGNYKKKIIYIAFNPYCSGEGEKEKFAVRTPFHLNAKPWIPDIFMAFSPDASQIKSYNQYLSDISFCGCGNDGTFFGVII